MNNPPINIILCGIGGQGIASATRKLHEHCLDNDWQCISAVYKGGAQRLGSVKAEIRLFPLNSGTVVYKSSQIIPGTLDALVVLEQWEGLRQISYCNSQTLILLNSFSEFPPGNQKSRDFENDPKSVWQKIPNNKIAKDFSKLANLHWGNQRHTAVLMLHELINKLQLNLTKINI